MYIEIISARNPRWLDADHTEIELLVTFAHCGEVPFTASAADAEEHGAYLFDRARRGDFGEVAAYVPPEPPAPPTLEQLINTYTDAVQKHLDSGAREKKYDNIVSACSYAGYPNPFRAEGESFGTWRAECWTYCYAELEKVQLGTRPLPTIPEILSELPERVIP